LTPIEGELREVGRIGRAHGVRGELYVSLITDRVERLAPGASLLAGERELVVATSRQANGRWIVTFAGIDDRTAAERLVGTVLHASALADADEDEDALWVHDLIGSRVVDQDGVERGTCVAVVGNPANDLLELDTGFLVPVNFVLRCAEGTIDVDTPEGLFDPA
jgi:16S rRNA processing protein RimM